MKRKIVVGGPHPAFYPVLVIACIVVLIPVLWMLSTAVKDETQLFSDPPQLWPDSPTLAAFKSVFNDYPFATYFKNSLVVVLSATGISIAFSAFAGYGLSRFKFRGRGTFLGFLLLSQMFPSVMLIIPYFKIMRTAGLLDSNWGLILTYISFTIPFCTWMMYGYFKSIPKDLDEAAALDGAGHARIFFSVILPLSLPGMVATAVYAFITAWNEYLFALILTNSEDQKTLPIGIGQLIGQYKIEWNELMAASIYSTIPIMVFFLFLQRYLISSLTAGAVKT